MVKTNSFNCRLIGKLYSKYKANICFRGVMSLGLGSYCRLGLNFRLVVNNALGLKSLIFCKSSQLARCLMIAVFIPK